MATQATKKQLDYLKQLTGKDYSDEELTAAEASNKIEKALANKVKDLPPKEPDMLPDHRDEVDQALKKEVGEMEKPAKSSGRNRAFALSYSKDIAVAKIAQDKPSSLKELLSLAVAFESYLDTGATVTRRKDETTKDNQVNPDAL